MLMSVMQNKCPSCNNIVPPVHGKARISGVKRYCADCLNRQRQRLKAAVPRPATMYIDARTRRIANENADYLCSNSRFNTARLQLEFHLDGRAVRDTQVMCAEFTTIVTAAVESADLPYSPQYIVLIVDVLVGRYLAGVRAKTLTSPVPIHVTDDVIATDVMSRLLSESEHRTKRDRIIAHAQYSNALYADNVYNAFKMYVDNNLMYLDVRVKHLPSHRVHNIVHIVTTRLVHNAFKDETVRVPAIKDAVANVMAGLLGRRVYAQRFEARYRYLNARCLSGPDIRDEFVKFRNTLCDETDLNVRYIPDMALAIREGVLDALVYRYYEVRDNKP